MRARRPATCQDMPPLVPQRLEPKWRRAHRHTLCSAFEGPEGRSSDRSRRPRHCPNSQVREGKIGVLPTAAGGPRDLPMGNAPANISTIGLSGSEGLPSSPTPLTDCPEPGVEQGLGSTPTATSKVAKEALTTTSMATTALMPAGSGAPTLQRSEPCMGSSSG